MGALDELVFIFQVLGKIVGRRKRKGKERKGGGFIVAIPRGLYEKIIVRSEGKERSF